jgi:glycine/sarcosine N-methyltransferase
MTEDFYAQIAPIYDRMIRWESRLEAERPWFEALWRHGRGVRTVLDAACGSGAHLALFAEQGLDATGSDGSEAMLDLARSRLGPEGVFPGPKAPRLIHSTWAELPQRLSETFDAVLCLGNSIPYVIGSDGVREATQGLWSCVGPGGFALIQFKNFARLRHLGERFLPTTSFTDPETGIEHLCLRQYDWKPEGVDFMVVLLSRQCSDRATGWDLSHWITPLATYGAEGVAAPLRALGAEVEVCGSVGHGTVRF